MTTSNLTNMQFKMAHSANELAHRQMTGSLKPSKHRTEKSQPFDAEDLRRRLYIVLSQQNAQKEEKRRARAEAAAKKAMGGEAGLAEIQQEVTSCKEIFTTLPESAKPASRTIVKPSTQQDATSPPGKQTSNTTSPDSTLTRSLSKSGWDKLHRKPSKLQSNPVEEADEQQLYHHVPQQAAAQFARTATADKMRGSNQIHSLSRQALRFYTEGSPSEKAELNSSKSPSDQMRALRRAQSHREKLHDRNQFQQTRALEDSGVGERISLGNLRQRHTIPGRTSSKKGRHGSAAARPKPLSIADILESTEVGDFGHSPPSPLSREVSSGDERVLGGIPEVVLAMDAGAGADADEHRVDWTQRDEEVQLQHREKSKSSTRIPLLRRADSIWALRAKISGMGRKDEDKIAVTIEKIDETRVVVTPGVKAPRFGFLARFKR
ncbi:uncharacterized protein BCR38DRAFT_435103 [Pseudomassariella vexata]|uniref:Uncharacterized protein n=1 Tax=Pseudomassariella vexata TaxID=1141098 RepID=A0A1Y2DYX5_9PEZI|nr:uncharacterized protein BCR38DRAFT_435103 [Pseudomassariella vexata]ORY64437.1 hypothetical protein BCR38DRAFT_435103 [Pseudomassariella vexata]